MRYDDYEEGEVADFNPRAYGLPAASSKGLSDQRSQPPIVSSRIKFSIVFRYGNMKFIRYI